MKKPYTASSSRTRGNRADNKPKTGVAASSVRNVPVIIQGITGRAGRTHADLMQHPEGAEGWRWCEGRRIVSGQFQALPGGLKKCNTLSLAHF